MSIVTKKYTIELPQGEELTTKNEFFRYHMHEVLDKIRAQAPIYKDSKMHRWVITQYSNCRDILKDKDGFGRDWMALAAPETFGTIYAPQAGKWSILNEDGERHKLLRNIVSKTFTPKSLENLRPKIEKISAQLIDVAKKKSHFDFINDISAPAWIGDS